MAHRKEPACNAGDTGVGLILGLRSQREMQPTPVFLSKNQRFATAGHRATKQQQFSFINGRDCNSHWVFPPVWSGYKENYCDCLYICLSYMCVYFCWVYSQEYYYSHQGMYLFNWFSAVFIYIQCQLPVRMVAIHPLSALVISLEI